MTADQRAGHAADRAHAFLRDEIMQGRIASGTMLSENEIASTLAMSRTPVRAALTRLQDEGWVTIYPKRGALVREFTETELRESADVRHALESAGIQRGSAGRRERLADQLAENITGQEEALARSDFVLFTTLAMRFHRTFVEMAGNSIMLGLYDRLQDRQQLSIVRSAGRISDDPQRVLAEHRTLLDDARRGDWTAFATHLNDHQARNHDVAPGAVSDC